jgi:hypothetical protein
MLELNHNGPLSPAQVNVFVEFGWVHIPGFFGKEATEEIRCWTQELAAMPEVPGKSMVYHEPSLLNSRQRVIQRIENFCPHHDGFDAMCRGGSLVEAVSQVLGSKAVLFKDKINFKMAGGAGFEPHQDQQAGWTKYAPLFATALVGIDRATVENGCLEMADVPRLNTLLAPEWRPLNETEVSSFNLVPVKTEPGDLLIFDSFALHASKPNLTSAQRRLLYLTYNSQEYGDRREEYFRDKRASFPPDVERDPSQKYVFRV